MSGEASPSSSSVLLNVRTSPNDAVPPSNASDLAMMAWRDVVSQTISPTARAALRDASSSRKLSKKQRQPSSAAPRLPSVVCSPIGQQVIVDAMMSVFHNAVRATLSPSSRTDEPSSDSVPLLLPRPSLFLDGCNTDHLPAAPTALFSRTVAGAALPSSSTSFQRSGDDKSILFVHQGEYGFLVSNSNNNDDASHRNEDKVLPSPKAWIASVDATSCVVVGIRCHHPGRGEEAVGMTHLDIAGLGAIEVLRELLHDMVLPALLLLSLRKSDEEKQEEGSSGVQHHHNVSTTKKVHVVEVEWFIVGGMRDRKYALPMLSDLSYFLTHELQSSYDVRVVPTSNEEDASAAGEKTSFDAEIQRVPVLLTHVLRLDGVCVWDMNTAEQTSRNGHDTLDRCCVWGMQIALGAHGLCLPCHVAPESRRAPADSLRDILCGDYRRLSPSMADDAAVEVYRVQPAEPSAARMISWPANTSPHCVGAAADMLLQTSSTPVVRPGLSFFYAFVTKCIEVVASSNTIEPPHLYLPFMIEVGAWGQPRRILPRELGKMDDKELLQWSTTPHCEPPDFALYLRRKMILQTLLRAHSVFGSEAGTIGPLVLI